MRNQVLNLCNKVFIYLNQFFSDSSLQRENPNYQDILPYEDLVGLFGGQSLSSRHERDRGVYDPTDNPPWLSHSRRYDWSDDVKFYNRSHQRSGYQDEQRKMHHKSEGRNLDGPEMVLDTWEERDNRDFVESLKQPGKTKNKQRPGSGRQYKPSGVGNVPEEDNSGRSICLIIINY